MSRLATAICGDSSHSSHALDGKPPKFDFGRSGKNYPERRGSPKKVCQRSAAETGA